MTTETGFANLLEKMAGTHACNDRILDGCRALISSFDVSLAKLAQRLGDEANAAKIFLQLRHVQNDAARVKLNLLVRLIALGSSDSYPMREELYCFLEGESIAFLRHIVEKELFHDNIYIGHGKTRQFRRHNAIQLRDAKYPQLLTVYKLLSDLKPSKADFKQWLADQYPDRSMYSTLELFFDRFVDAFLDFFKLD